MPERSLLTKCQASRGSRCAEGIQDGPGSTVDNDCCCGIRCAICQGQLNPDEHACRLNIGPGNSRRTSQINTPLMGRVAKLHKRVVGSVINVEVINRSSRQHSPVTGCRNSVADCRTIQEPYLLLD